MAATKIRSTKSEIRNNIELPKFQCSKQEFSHEKAENAQKEPQRDNVSLSHGAGKKTAKKVARLESEQTPLASTSNGPRF